VASQLEGSTNKENNRYYDDHSRSTAEDLSTRPGEKTSHSAASLERSNDVAGQVADALRRQAIKTKLLNEGLESEISAAKGISAAAIQSMRISPDPV
jgi:hypothetical protein